MDALEELELTDVSYQAEGVSILRGVTARFERGKKYLITGPSGGGKSTLMSLLARMAPVTSGTFRINGADGGTIDKDAYRERVCGVFQEPYLFETTLEENILLGRSIPQEKYHKVIEKLNLTHLLERYAGRSLSPELVDTLSGGEKQRVCLARAMVGSPDVYLLDEVTSALDQETARRVEEAILSEEAMVIHICHKPSPELLEKYDAHYQLEQGRLHLLP